MDLSKPELDRHFNILLLFATQAIFLGFMLHFTLFKPISENYYAREVKETGKRKTE